MDIYYHLSVVGTPPANQFMLDKIDECLTTLCEELKKISTPDIQYIPCVLETDVSIDLQWDSLLKRHKISALHLPTPHETSLSGQPIPCTDRRRLVQTSDLADLVFAFWNEDPDGEEQPVWDALHRHTEKQIPCIWVSTKRDSVYWALNTLFEPYKEEILQERIQLLKAAQRDDTPTFLNDWKEHLMLFESRRQSSKLAHMQKGLESIPQVDDEMLYEDISLPNRKSKEVHRLLLEEYNNHDTWAIQLSNLYRGSIRLRCWLPILSTITLAFAFYINPVLTCFLYGMSNLNESGNYPSTQIIIAIAFFLNAFLYYYSHTLSRAKRVQNWHIQFLHHRLIAEILRFYLHVIPYGITLPLARTLNTIGFHSKEKNMEYAEIWNILHHLSSDLPPYDEKNTDLFLDHLMNYIDSQLQYHKKSAQRYEKITKIWKRKWANYFQIGFWLLIIRGLAQMFLIYGGNKGLWAQPEITKFWQSFANMLAMIVPAIATYINGKLSLSGYEESYKMDVAMIDRLEQALKLVKSMKGRTVNYSMIRNLVEKLELLMLNDVSNWEKEMEKCKIKVL